jgi:hypothetical protein
MKTNMKIAVQLSKTTVLLARGTAGGRQTVPVPAELTDAQRVELVHWTIPPIGETADPCTFYLMCRSAGPGRILGGLADTSPASIASVLDRLAEYRASEVRAQEAREAKEDAELEHRLAKAAGRPTADFLYENWHGGRHYVLRAPGVPDGAFAKRYPDQWAAAGALRDEKNAALKIMREKSAAAKDVAKAEAAKKAAAEIVARDMWIAENGSPRLKMILEEGMIDGSLSVYRDERLAVERPDWIWDAAWHDNDVNHRDVRNPSEDDLLWYRATRGQFPECKMIYAFLAAAQPEDYYEDDEDESTPRVSEVVIKDRFLGKTIILRRERA